MIPIRPFNYPTFLPIFSSKRIDISLPLEYNLQVPYGTLEVIMEVEIQQLMNDVNRAIIKFRGVYSSWSKKHGVNYNEMLVLYTIRDNGFCTQKQICENYLLPKQTVNHVITSMLTDGLLCDSP